MYLASSELSGQNVKNSGFKRQRGEKYSSL